MPRSINKFADAIFTLLPKLLKGLMAKQKDELTRGVITMPQFFVLHLIWEEGALKMTEIAHSLKVSLPAVSGLVDRLVSMGFAKRYYDSKDRRIIRIDLSKKGRMTLKRIESQRKRLMCSVFGKLTEKERRQYHKILNKLVKIVEA